jgi:hypothetical protein
VENKAAIGSNGGVELLIDLLSVHKGSVAVMDAVAGAVRNIVNKNREHLCILLYFPLSCDTVMSATLVHGLSCCVSMQPRMRLAPTLQEQWRSSAMS